MSDEMNIENVNQPIEGMTPPQANEDVPTAEASEKAPRRARKAKADAGASDRPAASVRRTRSKKTAEDGKPVDGKGAGRSTRRSAEPKPEEQLSSEVIQARALAQISQASIVRRQRRAAERAAEVLTAQESAGSDDGLDTVIPLVDPALRPNARGRKPKAYVEAEKAAAAARAAQRQALLEAHAAEQAGSDISAAQQDAPEAGAGVSPSAGRANDASLESVDQDGEVDAGNAPASGRKTRTRKRVADSQKRAALRQDASGDDVNVALSEDGQAPRSSAEPEESDRGDETAPRKDARPGRASRVRKSAPVDPVEGRQGDAAKDNGDSSDVAENTAAQHDSDKSAESKPEGKAARRNHQSRRETDKGEKSPAASKADARRERRERQKENRKQRNNRFAPTEPTLTREELAGMKVVELREKARELELDPTGIKKAELIEAVYAAAARAEGFRDIEGILDIDNQGFGYIRAHGYMPSRDDAFVPAQMIRAAGLRPGDYVAGTLRPMRANDKLPGLAKLRSVNGLDPEGLKRRPKFADLTPVYPDEPLRMEHGKESITGRAIDIVSPIGKGQRGLIVSPPKAGKTTILKKICQSISANNPEVHLICLLVDERPEEVTDMQRSIKGEVVASTFDMPADNHTRVSELVIERAKRIVELGGDVVVVLDSITRLARAYNLAAPASGRILSGGVDSAALYPPKRFLGAARNIEHGGSLTILASALIDTGSKMDEVIFEEFKGTGNMELKLDRDLADRRIFPAIDPIASGTRNEDLLVDEQMRPFVWGIRRILAGMNNTERAAASFIKGLKGTNSNQEFLIRTAKKAADHPDAL